MDFNGGKKYCTLHTLCLCWPFIFLLVAEFEQNQGLSRCSYSLMQYDHIFYDCICNSCSSIAKVQNCNNWKSIRLLYIICIALVLRELWSCRMLPRPVVTTLLNWLSSKQHQPTNWLVALFAHNLRVELSELNADVLIMHFFLCLLFIR